MNTVLRTINQNMKRARCTLPSLENAANPLMQIMTQPNYMTIRKCIFTELGYDNFATLWSLKVAFPGLIIDRVSGWNWLHKAHVSSMNYRHNASSALRLEIYQAIKSSGLNYSFYYTIFQAMEFDDPYWMLQEFWSIQVDDICKRLIVSMFRSGNYTHFIKNPGNGDGIITFFINEVYNERYGDIRDISSFHFDYLLTLSINKAYTFPSIMKLLRFFDGLCTFSLVEIYDQAWAARNVSVIRECYEAMNQSDKLIVGEYSLRHHLHFCNGPFRDVKNGSIADILQLDMELNDCMTMEQFIQILLKIINETTWFEACLPLLLKIYTRFDDALFDNDAITRRLWPCFVLELSVRLSEALVKYIHCIIEYFPDIMRRFRNEPLYTRWIQRIRKQSVQDNPEGTIAKRILGMLGA